MDMHKSGSNMRKRSSSRGFQQQQPNQAPSGFEAMDQITKKSIVHKAREEARNEARGYVPAKLDALQRPETPA
jgi:hypothetical protein